MPNVNKGEREQRGVTDAKQPVEGERDTAQAPTPPTDAIKGVQPVEDADIPEAGR